MTKVFSLNGILPSMEARKRIMDIEMIYIAIAFYTALAFFMYSVAFVSGPGTIFPVLYVILLAMFPLIVRANWNRYIIYRIDTDSLEMRFGSLFFFRKRKIERGSVGSVCIIDPYKLRFMKGKNERLPIHFIDEDGVDMFRIDQPPKKLIEGIERIWGIEPIKRTRTGFIQDLHERKMEKGR